MSHSASEAAQPADQASADEVNTDLAETETETETGMTTEEPSSDDPAVDPWTTDRLDAVLEAMLFASPEAISFRTIAKIIPEGAATREGIREGLDRLIDGYSAENRGISLTEIAGGYQFQTRPEHFEFVQGLVGTRREEKITRAALETLAIIAYKQPIARSEVDAIRGVGCGQLIRILMDKKLVKVVGREDLPGRPFLYGTTTHFLEHFGLRGVKDLPKGADL